MNLDDWNFDLPDAQIARFPAPERDGSRLLVLPLAGGPPQHRHFRDVVDFLRDGDLLIANDTRVMAARLWATRASGGQVEILLLEPGPGDVEALMRPGRRMRAGERLDLRGGSGVQVVERRGDRFLLRFDEDPAAVMAAQGEVPLPPYLARDASPEDVVRYQTTFAGPLGACAAPTAGLHFTPAVLDAARAKGARFAKITLHVGIGTFRPPKPEELAAGRLHTEPYIISADTVAEIAACRARGGRIIAVGTTTVRALESAVGPTGDLPVAGPGKTDILIGPGHRFRVVDALITNFHLPRSSLMLLVGAWTGRERLLAAYQEAIARGYRFYSYGDAMLLV